MNFTKAEMDRINQLYGNDFEDINPNDAQLIGRYEAYKAVTDAKVQAEIKALDDESKARLKHDAEIYQIAKQNLELLRDAAMEKYKAVKNEQQK